MTNVSAETLEKAKMKAKRKVGASSKVIKITTIADMPSIAKAIRGLRDA